LTRAQSKVRQLAGTAKVGNQRQRAVADGRLADTDEHIGGAQVEAAIEDSGNLRICVVSRESARQDAGPQDRDAAIRTGM
jgi:hypothetical protein